MKRKNLLIYMLFWLLFFGYDLFTANMLSKMLVVFYSSLPIFSFLYLFFSCFFLKTSQELSPASISRGDPAFLRVTLQSKGLLFYPSVSLLPHPNTGYALGSAPMSKIHLGALTKQELRYELLGKYRGIYEAGIQSVVLEDFLGVFRFSIKPTLLSLKVYPKLLPLPASVNSLGALLSESQLAASYKKKNFYETEGIRNYIPGDHPKHVHWKLSAKQSNLVVKEYAASSHSPIQILIDLQPVTGKEQNRLENTFIECLLSIVQECIANKFPVSLKYDADEIFTVPISPEQGIMRYYELISFLPFGSKKTFAHMLQEALLEKTPHTCIVLTTNYDPELHKTLCAHVLLGHTITLFYITEDEASASVLQNTPLYPTAGIKPFIITPKSYKA